MKYMRVALLLLLATSHNYAQVTDSFSDGDFTGNPTWFGDDTLFQVSAGILRLKGTVSSEACLATSQLLTDSVTWIFYTRFSLNPSSANYSRFYVMSDAPNLKGPLNGYYVQLGGSTGSSDSVGLYRQQGVTRTRIIAGRAGTLGKSTNQVRIRVWRSPAGEWQLYSDTLGGINFTPEGAARDTLVTQSRYCGWYVKYTGGYNQHHYLDEVSVLPPLMDTVAPFIAAVDAPNNRQLTVLCSEYISPACLVPAAFRLLPQNLTPASLTRTDELTLELTFNQAFTNKQQHTLLLFNMADTLGNHTDTLRASFRFYEPLLHDVLMSEWMPDPSPPRALPDAEFVELYNHSGIPIQLENYTLSDGSSTAVLPNYVLEAGAFVLLCSSAQQPLFAPYGAVIGVSGFPTLNNSGDRLTLKAANGTLMHEFTYSLNWYNQPEKQNGGWSIELINPHRACAQYLNTMASAADAGGTPGQANSQWQTLPDSTPPTLTALQVLNAQQVLLQFNGFIDSLALMHSELVMQPPLPLQSRLFTPPQSALFTFADSLVHQTRYTLLLKQVADCNSHTGPVSDSFYYLQPSRAGAYDVVVHEVLANPLPAQSEFVELYNRSQKVLSLNGWRLADGTTHTTLPHYWLMPDSMVVLAPTGTNLLCPNLLRLAGFPTLNNSGETLTLFNDSGRVIHALTYTDNWYTDARTRLGGVSLEMIDPQNPCGADNWRACTDSSGHTAGNANSVQGQQADVTPPYVLRVYPHQAGALEVFFSEPMDSTFWQQPGLFNVEPGVGLLTPTGEAPTYQRVRLLPSVPFLPQTPYLITIQLARDCAGNTLPAQTIAFSLPRAPDSTSLTINELLFNPATGGYDFVELYNKQAYAVDLRDVLIGHYDANGLPDVVVPCAPDGFMMAPGAYVVLTPDTQNLRQRYSCKYPEHLLPVNLPPMPDDEGNVALFTSGGTCIDAVYYHKSLHHPLLQDADGVSLERLDPWRPSNDAGNWTSASVNCGYGTPTAVNSQWHATGSTDNLLVLDPPVFSPDGDGHDDVLNLLCNTEESGYTATLTIYNDAGVPVMPLLNNALTGTQNVWSWDGRNQSGALSAPGMYLFYLELIRPDGVTKQVRKVGVLAATQR